MSEYRILIVDECTADREAYKRLLRADAKNTYVVNETSSATKALQLVSEDVFDCILLDYRLPDFDGLRLIRRLQEQKVSIAAVMVTGRGNEQVAVDALKLGARDYVVKSSLREQGLALLVCDAITRVRAQVAESQRVERWKRLANVDDLTGLYNRRYLLERLQQEADRSSRYHSKLSFCMVSIDRFTEVTDQFGHLAGDQVLRSVAHHIRSYGRYSDVVGRIGGEEFGIILPMTKLDRAAAYGERLRQRISEHVFPVDDTHSVSVTCSVGVASFDEADDSQKLIHLSDERLYDAKRSGRAKITAPAGKSEAHPPAEKRTSL